MTNVEKLGFGGMVLGAAGVIYAVYSQIKMNHICNKIDISIDKVSKNVDVDIPESLVNIAVNRAVDREVGRAIRNASIAAIDDVSKDLKREVRMEVRNAYSNLEKSVADEVTDQVSKIDMGAFKIRVEREAREKVLEKFDGDLDGLLKDFNQNLTNVSKIYSSIANHMDTTAAKAGGSTMIINN